MNLEIHDYYYYYLIEEKVKLEILNMNMNKSSGPDGIQARILQELVSHIALPITVILKQSAKDGKIPKDWKQANVIPIYKKGSKNIAENYRPVSLTSLVCKLMEKFIKESIMGHLVSENLLSKKQFGFSSGRSTTTQLLN